MSTKLALAILGPVVVAVVAFSVVASLAPSWIFDMFGVLRQPDQHIRGRRRTRAERWAPARGGPRSPTSWAGR